MAVCVWCYRYVDYLQSLLRQGGEFTRTPHLPAEQGSDKGWLIMAKAEFSVFNLGRYNSSTDNKALDSNLANINFMHAYFDSQATSGDNRGFYLRMKHSGAGGGGEALRAYSIANAALGTMHGAHVTAEVGAAGSISGLIAGMRATLGVATGLTLSAGSAYALRVDSDLASVVTGMTKAAYMNFAQVGAQDFTALMDFTGQTTADNTTSMLRYKAANYTLTCKGGFRIYTPDGTFWIPYGTLS